MVYFTVLDSRFQPYMDNKFQTVGVSGYITNSRDQLLIMRRAHDDTSPGWWETPGGGIDWGEDPADAIKREIKEECSLDVTIDEVYTVLSWISRPPLQNRHMIQIVYKCKLVDQTQKVILSSEHSEYKWVLPSEIKDEPLSYFLESLIK